MKCNKCGKVLGEQEAQLCELEDPHTGETTHFCYSCFEDLT